MQDHPWFGLYEWVEQVTTIPLTVIHHSCNESIPRMDVEEKICWHVQHDRKNKTSVCFLCTIQLALEQ